MNPFPRIIATCSVMSAIVLLMALCRIQAADPFAEFVRSTDPRNPQDELKAFHLPPGFEIQLVAAEPDIAKPMNMAFDSKGRLWLSQSYEYPYAAKLDSKGRDSIKVLSDFADDGRARKIATFADGLNIPIGLYPYKTGVIAFSIPNIYFFQDTDGDGRADNRELILGRFGFEKDTHGLTSAFRRGYDGWIYADHGFNNDSILTAKDGSSIKLNSGNTYRFKPDGSRVEQFTWGQVNPFGLMFDERGDLWSADCHSSPVYLLLRGGYYPSFGKPDDGLGFAPAVMHHSHGSTAISGIVVYNDDQWPAEFHGNTFVGNVMTCRINRDSYQWRGSTPVAKEEPDLLRCDDSWFRPNDLQLAPDGALYVSDFYNRIIGHYEVPLEHPGRDRERGRIWRIIYKGTNSTARPFHDLSKAAINDLIAELGAANITRRMLAMNEITDRIGTNVVERLRHAITSTTNGFIKVHAAWALHRLGAMENGLALAKDRDGEVRLHAMRILSETTNWPASDAESVRAGLQDSNPFVQRAAADALGTHPNGSAVPSRRREPYLSNVADILKLRQRMPKSDENLLRVVRMALRNQLEAEGSFESVRIGAISEADARVIASVAVAVPSPKAAAFLLAYVQKFSEPRETLVPYLRHVARYADARQFDDLTRFAKRKFGDDIDLQLALFKSVQEGVAQRGGKLTGSLRSWGGELAEILLSTRAGDSDWTNQPYPGAQDTKNPWFTQKRASVDGDENARFLCSLPPGGEHLTGTLRSKVFAIPARLVFYLAGHDGFPDKPPQKQNVVRLRSADADQVLAEKYPPRNDTAQKMEWELTDHAGKKGYIEIVDGDTGSAYAWLAIGRFDPEVLSIPRYDPGAIGARQQSGAELARTLALKPLEPRLAEITLDAKADLQARAAAASALTSFKPNDILTAVASLIGEADIPAAMRENSCGAIVTCDLAAAKQVLTEALRILPRRLQSRLAQSLAASAEGAENLLGLVADQKIPAALLTDRAVREKLTALKSSTIEQRLTELTRELPPANESFDKLIAKRRKGYDASKASPVNGAQLFAQNCAVCHQIDGQGMVIGPQLDGLGNRGLERLSEDLLDPNRSVDPAFRTTLFVLKDGDIVSGLFRRQEAELMVLADGAGKEITIPKSRVAERRESGSSLMPENFGDLFPQEQFNDLMAFLLSKGSAPR